jgi:NodT family efflux transporter outer membrane factor (OMF) lipoprotein
MIIRSSVVDRFSCTFCEDTHIEAFVDGHGGPKVKQLGHIFVVATAVVLSGCVATQQPGAEDLTVSVPGEWTVPSAAGDVADGWLNAFGDPVLVSRLEEALGNNLTLKAALARYDQAIALARIGGADRWPSLSLGGSASRAMSNNRADPPTRFRSDRFDIGATANWELDIWGRARAQALGAEASAMAAESDLEAFRLSLASRVVQAWFSAIEQRQQEALALETLTSFESNLTTVEERFRRGLNPALDLRLTRANVEAARANHMLQKRLADGAVRQLEVLLGRYPSGTLELPETLPQLDGPVPAGVPADLLLRRPDLDAASQRVVSSQAGLIESKRSLLPSISLTASYGRASAELEDILKDTFDVWSLLGNLTAPVFQGGRLRANVDLSDAQLQEAVANYQNAALIAFQEVESALSAEQFLREQKTALELSAEESAGAQQLAEERYERGLVEIITVLESQRRAFTARSNALSIQNQLLQNRLTLYLALGGDVE